MPKVAGSHKEERVVSADCISMISEGADSCVLHIVFVLKGKLFISDAKVILPTVYLGGINFSSAQIASKNAF